MSTRPSTITAIQLCTRAASSAALAVALARLLTLQHPVYAVIAAVIVTDLSPSKTVQLALQRLAGTVIGAMVGAAFSLVVPSGPLAIGLSILAAMLLSHVVHLQAAAKLAGYVCGIVVLAHGAEPWPYALYRLIETVLGIAMAVLVSLVPRLMNVQDRRRKASQSRWSSS